MVPYKQGLHDSADALHQSARHSRPTTTMAREGRELQLHSPIAAFMNSVANSVARAFCLPHRNPHAQADMRMGHDDHPPTLERALALLHELEADLPRACRRRLAELTRAVEAARASFEPKLDAEAALARHLKREGSDIDEDTEEWLRHTALPTSSRKSNASRTPAKVPLRSGGMKRIMTAPVMLTQLDAPTPTVPPVSPLRHRSGGGSMSAELQSMRSVDSLITIRQHRSANADSTGSTEPGVSGVAASPDEGARQSVLTHAQPAAGKVRPPASDGAHGVVAAASSTGFALPMVTRTPATAEVARTPSTAEMPTPGHEWRLIAGFAAPLALMDLDYAFDVDELDVASGGHCLTALFAELMRRHDLPARLAEEAALEIDLNKLGAFLLRIEATYCHAPHGTDNAYHDRRHAADVVLGMHRFLAESSGAPWSLSPLEVFAGLFAAAIHDFAHPGTTNAHEIGRVRPRRRWETHPHRQLRTGTCDVHSMQSQRAPCATRARECARARTSVCV